MLADFRIWLLENVFFYFGVVSKGRARPPSSFLLSFRAGTGTLRGRKERRKEVRFVATELWPK